MVLKLVSKRRNTKHNVTYEKDPIKEILLTRKPLLNDVVYKTLNPH